MSGKGKQPADGGARGNIGGKPTKLTPELVAKIEKLIPRVLYLEYAADSLKVSRQSLWNWERRGSKEVNRLRIDPSADPKPEEAVYVEYFYAIKKAFADLVEEQVAAVKEGGKDWTCHAWILERRWPDKFGSDKKLLAQLTKQLAALEKQIGDKGN